MTADQVSVRTYAGEEYAQIKSYPILKYGNKVDVCDSLKANSGLTWYYIRISGKIYGFAPARSIEKAS